MTSKRGRVGAGVGLGVGVGVGVGVGRLNTQADAEDRATGK